MEGWTDVLGRRMSKYYHVVPAAERRGFHLSEPRERFRRWGRGPAPPGRSPLVQPGKPQPS